MKRQEAFLQQAYQERMADREELEVERDDDSEWDPVEEVLEGERESFLFL